MPYGASFAAVYDALMAEDFDYTAWAAYYTDLLASAGVHPGYLVECGCGTASLGIEWARRGIRVLGVDQGPDMLAIAAQRASRARASGYRAAVPGPPGGRHRGHLRYRELSRFPARRARVFPARTRRPQGRRSIGIGRVLAL